MKTSEFNNKKFVNNNDYVPRRFGLNYNPPQISNYSFFTDLNSFRISHAEHWKIISSQNEDTQIKIRFKSSRHYERGV